MGRMVAPMTELPPRPELDRFSLWALGVLALVVASLVVYSLRYGIDSLFALAGISLTVFVSKLAIFGGAWEGHAFSPWALAVIAWEIDLIVASLLLLWVGRIELLPIVGPAMRQAHFKAAEALVKFPGLRRMAVTGITFFVFLPLPGSGAVTGTLIGQIVGLSRRASFLTIATGAGLASVAYAAVAVYLGEQWRELIASPWTLSFSILGFLVFAMLAWRYVKRVLSTA